MTGTLKGLLCRLFTEFGYQRKRTISRPAPPRVVLHPASPGLLARSNEEPLFSDTGFARSRLIGVVAGGLGQSGAPNVRLRSRREYACCEQMNPTCRFPRPSEICETRRTSRFTLCYELFPFGSFYRCATEVIAPMTGNLLNVFDPRNCSALERRQGKNLHVAVASGRDDLLFAEEGQEMHHALARRANRDAP
jgi:hypothetical protein